jgi:hypothetical protein
MATRATHDRMTDGNVPVEVEANAWADGVELAEHEEAEEAVLEPRDAVGVRHQIHLPPLVHGHHGGFARRASRGGYDRCRHRLEAGITVGEDGGGRRRHGSACGLVERERGWKGRGRRDEGGGWKARGWGGGGEGGAAVGGMRDGAGRGARGRTWRCGRLH